MPCGYNEDHTSDYIREIDTLTRLLCYVCGRFKSQEQFRKALSENKELKEWWKNHQKEDEERVKKEAEDKKISFIREKALKKLTVKERKALLGK